MSEGLKECPCCRTPDPYTNDRDDDFDSSICCQDCGCRVEASTLEEAAIQWNRRTAPPATKAVLEMLGGWKQHLTFTGYDVEHFDDCLAEWPETVTPPPGDGPGHA